MTKQLNTILQGLGEEIPGFIAASVVGMDGLGIAHYTKSSSVDVEAINAQLTLLVKLVDTTVQKLNAGILEDELVTTNSAYLLVRYMEDKSYYLSIAADRKVSSLGNLRLMSRLFSTRLSKAMPT